VIFIDMRARGSRRASHINAEGDVIGLRKDHKRIIERFSPCCSALLVQ
jgi:hypothetical protein